MEYTSGVIIQVISKLVDCKAQNRFEITSNWVTPWIAWHKVQLPINHIYNKFQNKKIHVSMSFENFFLSENKCSAFHQFWKL